MILRNIIISNEVISEYSLIVDIKKMHLTLISLSFEIHHQINRSLLETQQVRWNCHIASQPNLGCTLCTEMIDAVVSDHQLFTCICGGGINDRKSTGLSDMDGGVVVGEGDERVDGVDEKC